MARVIYKYRFEEDKIRAGQDYIEIPPGKVLLVAQQGFHMLPTIWVEHLVPVASGTIRYRIAGTGHPIGDEFASWTHVGSCICDSLVWHVYRGPT